MDRLLLQLSVMSSSLQDGPIMNVSPAPTEETSGEPLGDRRDLPWGATFELPQMLLERDSDGNRSSKSTPLRRLGKQDSLLPPPALHILLTPPMLELQALEKHQPSMEHPSESQLSPAHLQPPKPAGRSFFPAVPVPVASKTKPSLSFHTEESVLQGPEVSFTFPSAMWQSNTASSRPPLLPRDIRGSTDSRGRRQSPLPPNNPSKLQGGSAKRPRRPK